MESKIIITSKHGLKFEVGKPQQRIWSDESTGLYANLMTNFEPLQQAILILEIRACSSVEYFSNIAFYGEFGGLAVKLKDKATIEDFIKDLKKCIDDEDNRQDLVVTQHPSSNEQE